MEYAATRWEGLARRFLTLLEMSDYDRVADTVREALELDGGARAVAVAAAVVHSEGAPVPPALARDFARLVDEEGPTSPETRRDLDWVREQAQEYMAVQFATYLNRANLKT